MKNNTLGALNESISNSKKIKKIILDNFLNKERKELRLNLVYITYNFISKRVLIEYYVKDDEYPSIEMSFDELANFIKE